ncbi:MAG: alternate-type signal peptide domain-containing protein [Leifsonia sp.]
MEIHMKKLTTALVASGSGLILLIGTSGSLALWNDAATVDAGSVASGVLTINAANGAWTQQLQQWVPGDTETYTAEVSIVAQGDNLASQVKIDPGSITGDPELLGALEISLTFGTPTGGTLTPVAGESNVYDVAPDNPTSGTPITAPVTVTVTFPADSVTGTVAQGQTVQLGGMQFVLDQVTA